MGNRLGVRTFVYDKDQGKMVERIAAPREKQHFVVGEFQPREGSRGNMITSRAQLREENRKGRSLHVSEIPFIQQDRESDRKSAAAADKRSRLASVISAAKGHGFL